MTTRVWMSMSLLIVHRLLSACHGDHNPVASKPMPAGCDADNGGITLPAGFCASVFADHVGGARHVAVGPNGDVYVALLSPPAGGQSAGGILVLRDTSHSGRANVRGNFGSYGGTGIAVYNGYLYVDAGSAIVRYKLSPPALTPSATPDTIVRALPTGGHGARNIAFDAQGRLYVNVGSNTNSCQQNDRSTGSPGIDPCTELATRAGIWRFDANRLGQTQATGEHIVTGIRNAMGLALNPTNQHVYATQHGRDQLYQNWPQDFDAVRGAENPAEELVQLRDSGGDDFGWPYCYFDSSAAKLLLAPEYGGDGTIVGRCASKQEPVMTFPGHWAPMSLMFYSNGTFPAHYQGGAFIAFHGSWNRAPQPQAGFRVVFVPFVGGQPSGTYETFANGFAGSGPIRSASDAAHRPVGLAQAPDGALYVTDDDSGRIWRIVYRGAAQ